MSTPTTEPEPPTPIAAFKAYYKRFAFNERDNELELVLRIPSNYKREGYKVTDTTGRTMAVYIFDPRDLGDTGPYEDDEGDWDDY